VTGLTADPYIYKIGDYDDSTDISNGEIGLLKQHRGQPIVMAANRHNRFLVTGHCLKLGASTDQTINEMMAEMIRLLDANNESGTRSYHFEVISEEYNGNYQDGVIFFTVECIELWVSIVA
jgi:hypothetical protein